MNLIQLLLICTFLQSSSSSSSDSSIDRKKEFKKVKKSFKKFTKVTGRLVKKKLVSVENLHEVRSFVTGAMN
jgi:predicted small secreted protein